MVRAHQVEHCETHFHSQLLAWLSVGSGAKFERGGFANQTWQFNDAFLDSIYIYILLSFLKLLKTPMMFKISYFCLEGYCSRQNVSPLEA